MSYDHDLGDQPPLTEPEPTTEELCADDGHRYAGDDTSGGRCYCGTRRWPNRRTRRGRGPIDTTPVVGPHRSRLSGT